MGANTAERRLSQEKETLLNLAKDVKARPELLIFGSKNWIVKRFTELSERLLVLNEVGKLNYKRYQPSFFHKHILPLLDGGFKSALYLIVAFKPDVFEMPISQLTFLETSVHDVFYNLSRFRSSLSDSLIYDLFRVRNLFECLEFSGRTSRVENPAPYESHSNGMKIEAKNLTFKYNKEHKPVLNDVSFTIERGEIVSIVGYNGSGSASLTYLI
jgi:ABC-type multidrug transport system fused ATPase/permease subunit